METYIHLSKYSRWIQGQRRRETWPETVDRLINYWKDKVGFEEELEKIRLAILNKDVMPSMRSMMTAGPALDRDHAAAYNCAAISIDNPRVFDEIFYLLMCGSGVGFSVERQYTNKLPTVAEELHPTDTVIKVRDSKIGWAKGLKELIALLYNGDVPCWDLSAVRPAGARLKTFGGRASGPEPLDRLFHYTVALFKRAAGRKLNSLECHDLCCKIAETVIVGSVRRSAMISFQNLTDDRCRRAKNGEWYLQNPERMLANNSVMYTERPDLVSFLKEMTNLYQSKAGERGIVNQEALRKKALSCGRDMDHNFLLNP
jgi:ribonucleoside-diphosphate reductase alpha chain